MHLPRHAELWLPGYLASMVRARRERRAAPITDVMFCVCDHYEPLLGRADAETGWRRVERWLRDYPAFANKFHDSDGIVPQHSFFFPIEEYSPKYLDALADLAGGGFGEVEIHLHHDNDTSENLREQLRSFTKLLRERHGHLTQDETGNLAYAFIHGNWALDNSLPGGKWCGVNDEITILRETGCYADFTLPSAPSPAQIRTVNRIYYATDDPARPRSHETGPPVRVGQESPVEALLMVQGPLAFSSRRAKWGLLPRLENATIHGGHPATATRLADWLDCAVTVEGRPEWVFVKLHTHGAPDWNADALLGPESASFHGHLAKSIVEAGAVRLHYVTAREVANIVWAAEAGKTGNAGCYRNFRHPVPPCRRR